MAGEVGPDGPGENALSSLPRENRGLRALVGLVAIGVIAWTIHAYIGTTQVKVLARRLGGGDPTTRLSSARDLAMTVRDLADFEIASDALMLGLSDSDMDVRAQSAVSLGTIYWASSHRDPDDQVPAAEVARRLGGVVGGLLANLQDPESFVRASAATALGMLAEFGDRDAPADLVRAMDDPVEDVRSAAARALAMYQSGLDGAATTILARLPDEPPVSRAAFLSLAFGLRPTRSAIPSLLAALGDPHRDRRATAARLLGNLQGDGSPALDALIRSLESESGGQTNPRPAPPGGDAIGPTAVALARIAKPTGQADRVLPILTAALRRTEGTSHDGVATAIGLFDEAGVSAVPDLLTDLDARLATLPPSEPVREAQESLAATSAALARVAKGSATERKAIDAIGRAWKRLGSKAAAAASLVGSLRSFGPSASAVYPELDDPKAIGFLGSPPGPTRGGRVSSIAD